jgi:drug/metabolite transporter (DMT)-like permease
MSNGWNAEPLRVFHDAIARPHPQWAPATLAGVAYGMVAFFSVFIFMFKGRTATFAGLVNRLTSLVAGTAATLISYFIFQDKFPSSADWIALGLIFIAVAFLSAAERKRVSELMSEAKP